MSKNRDNPQDKEKDEAYSYLKTQDTAVIFIHELISIHGPGITTSS